MKLSRRTAWESAENAHSLYARTLKDKVDLTLSNLPAAGFAPPTGLLEALGTQAARFYDPHPLGLMSAREAVAAYYMRRSVQMSADDIVLTASTSEAYHTLFCALCDPGDVVLTPTPSYPLFSYLADIAAVRIRHYPLRYAGEWAIDLSELESCEDARAVVIVSPNNPTGSCVRDSEWKQLCAIAKARDLCLIVDAVFADYVMTERFRFLRDDAVNVVTLSGLSKVAALPQLKLGWMHLSGPDRGALMSRVELIQDAFLSVSSPVQHAADALLRHAERVQPDLRARTRNNLATLTDSLVATQATVLAMDGGFSSIIRLSSERDEDAWMERFYAARVLVQPGHFYDLGPAPHVVVSLLPLESTFARGVSRMVSALAST
jgi:alanine-synthesizing transaminase